MEEAEALSTKMGIMVRGGIFRCFGSSQHIKNKYGTGYEAEIKIRKPSFDELVEVSAAMGFADPISTRIMLSRVKNEAKEVDFTIMEQITERGLGADLVLEAERNNGMIKLQSFANFVFTQRNGLKVCELLASNFEQVELIEQCGDFFKFRIPREDKTIGFLFGLVEDRTADFNISEYSISQTSLEQIFQAFAN